MDDLTGFLLEQSAAWTVLSLPAIAVAEDTIALPHGRTHRRRIGGVLFPDREPRDVLDEMRRQLGSDLFEAQYQQSPVPPGGAMIKKHWIKRYSEPPPEEGVILQSWDTAARGGPENDWSVCTTWRQMPNGPMYLLDVWRGRVNYPDLKAKVLEFARAWPQPTVLVEEAGTALGLLDELSFYISLIGVKPERDKGTRMAIASAKIEAGQVFLPTHAPWLAELEAELFAFPGARHDDQVDSISQALNYENPMRIWAQLAG
jgi:predicted phage terminase large subunit-like protein